MAKAKKSAKKPAPKARKTAKNGGEVQGDHVRMLAPEKAVTSYIKDVLASKLSTSAEGQRLSTATKRAMDAGVNVPAARSAARTIGMAQRDGAKARTYQEDYLYYCDCMGFDKLAPVGMFTPEESGQKRSKPKPKQTEMPLANNPQHLLDAADKLEQQVGPGVVSDTEESAGAPMH